MMIQRFLWAVLAATGLLASPGLAVGAGEGAPNTREAIPLKDFLRRAEMDDMKLSPGGQYLAMTVPLEDGDNVLYVVDRKNLKPSATIRAAGNNIVHEFFWANDTRLIATAAEKLGGVDRPSPNGQLYAIDADGGNSKLLFGYKAGQGTGSRVGKTQSRLAVAMPVATLLDDPRNMLVQVLEFRSSERQVSQLEKLNVDNGSTTRVAVGPSGEARGFVADNAGNLRLAWGQTGEMESLLWLRGEEGGWEVWNDSGKSGVHMQPLRFARDDTHVYMRISRRNKADALYKVNLADRTQTLLYEGNADPSRLLDTADGRDAWAVITTDGITGVHVFDADAPEARATVALAQAFPGYNVVFTSFSRDGKLGLARVSNDRDAGDWYLFDMETRQASYLTSPRKWLDADDMAAMKPVAMQARDGLTLHGYLTLPPGSDGRNLPLVVNPHGGPHGVRDYWGFNPEAQILASRGYAVLQVNFRGSGGYGVDFQAAGYRQWGLAMQDDLTDATRWAIEQGIADPRRICIYGASYGGYAALQGAVREPDLYRCTIGYVGVYDLPMMYQRGDIRQSLYGRAYLERVLSRDRQDMLARSPVAGADRIKAAVMLIHGGRDVRVPIAHATAMRAALDKAGHPYEYLVKESEGHGFYDIDNNLELYTRLLEFLDRHIGPNARADAGSAAAAAPAGS